MHDSLLTDLKSVTIGIKTFFQTEKLKHSFQSLIGIDVKEIIIANDKTEDSKKEGISSRKWTMQRLLKTYLLQRSMQQFYFYS